MRRTPRCKWDLYQHILESVSTIARMLDNLIPYRGENVGKKDRDLCPSTHPEIELIYYIMYAGEYFWESPGLVGFNSAEIGLKVGNFFARLFYIWNTVNSANSFEGSSPSFISDNNFPFKQIIFILISLPEFVSVFSDELIRSLPIYFSVSILISTSQISQRSEKILGSICKTVWSSRAKHHPNREAVQGPSFRFEGDFVLTFILCIFLCWKIQYYCSVKGSL